MWVKKWGKRFQVHVVSLPLATNFCTNKNPPTRYEENTKKERHRQTDRVGQEERLRERHQQHTTNSCNGNKQQAVTATTTFNIENSSDCASRRRLRKRFLSPKRRRTGGQPDRLTGWEAVTKTQSKSASFVLLLQALHTHTYTHKHMCVSCCQLSLGKKEYFVLPTRCLSCGQRRKKPKASWTIWTILYKVKV